MQKQLKRRNEDFRKKETVRKLQSANRQQVKEHIIKKRKLNEFREQKLVQKKKRTMDTNHKHGEKLRDSRQKCLKFRENEKVKKQNRKFYKEEMVKDFHKFVQQGPLYICTCCDQLWYRHRGSYMSAHYISFL